MEHAGIAVASRKRRWNEAHPSCEQRRISHHVRALQRRPDPAPAKRREWEANLARRNKPPFSSRAPPLRKDSGAGDGARAHPRAKNRPGSEGPRTILLVGGVGLERTRGLGNPVHAANADLLRPGGARGGGGRLLLFALA